MRGFTVLDRSWCFVHMQVQKKDMEDWRKAGLIGRIEQTEVIQKSLEPVWNENKKLYVSVCLCVCVCVCVCLSVSLSLPVCLSEHACIYIYIYIHAPC